MDPYNKFVSDLSRNFNLDLKGYKRPQMERRINSLMGTLKINGYDDFITQMKADNVIFNRFVDHLTINVSEFFRNQAQWEVLENLIIPHLQTVKQDLKIWSAGCSTGQEPYSLSMLLAEKFPRGRHSILATDFDPRVLEKAKKGEYTEKELVGVDKLLLNKYFDSSENGFTIKNDIQRIITFKRHNLLKDRFETNFDLILCRNVVIYFTEETKRKLYEDFFNSLRSGGILFTGSTEQIISAKEIGYTSKSVFFYERP